MDWVKQHTSIKYAYTMALVHAGDDSPLPFVQPPSQISQNGQWLTTAMSAMTSSIRNWGGEGVNHVKRDWLEIFNVNCDLYLFFCVKRDWGYLRET